MRNFVFLTVGRGGTTPSTYMVEIVYANTAYLADISVTDDDPDDDYKKLIPGFDPLKRDYKVKVGALETNIEFTILGNDDADLSMKKDGESAHKLLSVREMKKAFDLDLATKEFKFIFEINKPASGSDPGGKGQYVVTVIRDTAASEAVVQTYIKGKVRLYGPDASSVIRLFDSSGNQVVAGKDGIAMDYEVGADGAFEIQPR